MECGGKRGRDAALDRSLNMNESLTKAPSSLRSADALQIS